MSEEFRQFLLMYSFLYPEYSYRLPVINGRSDPSIPPQHKKYVDFDVMYSTAIGQEGNVKLVLRANEYTQAKDDSVVLEKKCFGYLDDFQKNQIRKEMFEKIGLSKK